MRGGVEVVFVEGRCTLRVRATLTSTSSVAQRSGFSSLHPTAVARRVGLAVLICLQFNRRVNGTRDSHSPSQTRLDPKRSAHLAGRVSIHWELLAGGDYEKRFAGVEAGEKRNRKMAGLGATVNEKLEARCGAFEGSATVSQSGVAIVDPEGGRSPDSFPLPSSAETVDMVAFAIVDEQISLLPARAPARPRQLQAPRVCRAQRPPPHTAAARTILPPLRATRRRRVQHVVFSCVLS